MLKERPPADWSFVYHAGWICSHLFVLACIVAFINLGFWQLSRLHGRRQVNAMIEARMVSPAVPIQSLVGPHENYQIANHRDFRQVTVTGHYDTANQMLIRDEQDAQNDPGLVAGHAPDPARRLGGGHQPRVRARSPWGRTGCWPTTRTARCPSTRPPAAPSR